MGEKITVINEVEKEQLVLGLVNLMADLNYDYGYYNPEYIKYRKELFRHPFGLEIGTRKIIGLGHTGCTEISVQLMIMQIRKMVVEDLHGGIKPDYLRIIFVQDYKDFPENNDVFFELAYKGQVFICGGCTDCSGEGGAGKLKMDSIFALLSVVYGARIELVKISYDQAQHFK